MIVEVTFPNPATIENWDRPKAWQSKEVEIETSKILSVDPIQWHDKIGVRINFLTDNGGNGWHFIDKTAFELPGLKEFSKMYVLEALRNGLRECHSYVVAVMIDREEAIKFADQYCADRAGKYSISVQLYTINDKNSDMANSEIYRAKGRFDTPEYHKEWTLKRYGHQ